MSKKEEITMENKQKLKRPIQRIVRFSKEENDVINRKIEKSFYPNFQNFALHLLIQGEIRHVDYSELNKLTTEIHKIGINLNQMARLANQFHEISSEDIKDLTNEVQHLHALVQNELTQLIKRKEQS